MLPRPCLPKVRQDLLLLVFNFLRNRPHVQEPDEGVLLFMGRLRLVFLVGASVHECVVGVFLPLLRG